VGANVATFPTEKDLSSWVGACPGDEESAGVNYSYRSPHKSIRVPQSKRCNQFGKLDEFEKGSRLRDILWLHSHSKNNISSERLEDDFTQCSRARCRHESILPDG